MERIQVKSGQVKSLGWESAGAHTGLGTLEVEFTSGAVYAYKNVPYIEYTKFLGAESLGRHFASFIRPCFEFERVHAEGCGKYLECKVPLCQCFCHANKKGVSHAKPANENLEKDLKKSIKAARAKKRTAV